MLAIQQPRPLPFSIEQHPQIMNQSLPRLSELQEGIRLGRCNSRSREGSLVVQTNAPGLRTPPSDMDVNPLLVPNYGPLQYKGVPVVASNTSSHHRNTGSIGNTTYASRAQPILDSYQPAHRSHNSTSNDGSIGTRVQSSRRRNSEGGEIVHYLQIPSTINDSKGSLAEFAAQVRQVLVIQSKS